MVKLLIFIVVWCLPACAMESGILKLNQIVLPETIIADRRADGAVTLDEVIYDVKSFIHPSSYTKKHDSVDTTKRTSFESTSDETSTVSTYPPGKTIWAIDLSESYMDECDFNTFMTTLLPDLDQLQILILSSVKLNDASWDILLPLLERENFEYLDVNGVTSYSNSRIKPILERGKRRYPGTWLSLSRKLIFSNKTYIKKLKESTLWIQSCIGDYLLDPNWHQSHITYYTNQGIKQIKQAHTLNLLTGDDAFDLDSDVHHLPYSGEEDEITDQVKTLSIKGDA